MNELVLPVFYGRQYRRRAERFQPACHRVRRSEPLQNLDRVARFFIAGFRRGEREAERSDDFGDFSRRFFLSWINYAAVLRAKSVDQSPPMHCRGVLTNFLVAPGFGVCGLRHVLSDVAGGLVAVGHGTDINDGAVARCFFPKFAERFLREKVAVVQEMDVRVPAARSAISSHLDRPHASYNTLLPALRFPDRAEGVVESIELSGEPCLAVSERKGDKAAGSPPADCCCDAASGDRASFSLAAWAEAVFACLERESGFAIGPPE